MLAYTSFALQVCKQLKSADVEIVKRFVAANQGDWTVLTVARSFVEAAEAVDGSPLVCSNPACRQAVQDGGRLQKCVRCQRVAYCGRECQKAHWKRGHKRECTPVEGAAPSSRARHANAVLSALIEPGLSQIRLDLLQEPAGSQLAGRVLLIDSTRSSRVDLLSVHDAMQRLGEAPMCSLVVQSLCGVPASALEVRRQLDAYAAACQGAVAGADPMPEYLPAVQITLTEIKWTGDALRVAVLAEEIAAVRAMAVVERTTWVARQQDEAEQQSIAAMAHTQAFLKSVMYNRGGAM